MQRAISKETGKWVYGTYFDGFILSGEVIEATEEYITIEEWHPVKEDTLCNCLEIKDSEGNVVYENDVIELHYPAGNEDLFIIRKIEGVTGYGAYSRQHPGYPHQVKYILGIGNIVGNPYTNKKLKELFHEQINRQ